MNYMLILFIIIIIFVVIMSIVCCSKDIRESYKTTRDFQLYCTQIENMNDFRDYCIARVGTQHIEDLDMSNETKIKVAEDYLKGIETMKELARANRIAINRVPLYGKLAKNNTNIHDFTSFRDYL